MSQNKKPLMDREVTRRQFMKLTGKGLAGVALSSSMLSLLGCTQAQADAGLVDIVPTPHFVLVANRAKCTGCQRCEANCTLANDGDMHPYMSRIRVRQNFNFGGSVDPEKYAEGEGIYGNFNFGPVTCEQCDICMNACPMHAISADPATGTRVIDQEKCVGCGACTAACPHGLPRVDVDTKKSTKCIACGACVAGCPTSALRMVSWEEIQAAM